MVLLMIKKASLIALAICTVVQISAAPMFASAASASTTASSSEDYQLKAALELAGKLAAKRSRHSNFNGSTPSRESGRRDLDGVMILGGSEIVPM
jgi:hypothetical protein